MADLNVQPKKQRPVWPWILVALIIAAIILFMARGTDEMDTMPGTNDTTDTINDRRTDTVMP